MQKTLLASAVLTALTFASQCHADADVIYVWNSAAVPEIAESTFVFDGAQVQKDNKGLGVTNGASGTLNNLELSLSQQVNGSASSKQLDAVIVQGGDVNFAGDVLNLSVVTDFKGTGNNHVTAFNVDNSKAKGSSSKPPSLSDGGSSFV